MSVSLGRNSRLRFANLIQADGIEFFDLVELPTIPEQVGDLLYRVQDTDRIDSIAFKFYGSPTLWWVIAVANNMELIPVDLEPGNEIRIPSPSWVSGQLFQQAKVR